VSFLSFILSFVLFFVVSFLSIVLSFVLSFLSFLSAVSFVVFSCPYLENHGQERQKCLGLGLTYHSANSPKDTSWCHWFNAFYMLTKKQGGHLRIETSEVQTFAMLSTTAT
jgi:hypothetical protein